MATYYDTTIELDTNEDGQEIVTNTYMCTFEIDTNDDIGGGYCALIEVWKDGFRVKLEGLSNDDVEFLETTAWNRYMEGAL